MQHRLLRHPRNTLQTQVNQTAVAELVTELWGCLVLPEPGLQCELVQRLTATSGAPAQHYVGILHTLTAHPQVWGPGKACYLNNSASQATCSDGQLHMEHDKFGCPDGV
jgi:hypothetical protein